MPAALALQEHRQAFELGFDEFQGVGIGWMWANEQQCVVVVRPCRIGHQRQLGQTVQSIASARVRFGITTVGVVAQLRIKLARDVFIVMVSPPPRVLHDHGLDEFVRH